MDREPAGYGVSGGHPQAETSSTHASTTAFNAAPIRRYAFAKAKRAFHRHTAVVENWPQNAARKLLREGIFQVTRG